MPNVTWLADCLRGAGLLVVEDSGWKARGRGEFGQLRGVIIHHTAGPRTGNAPSLDTVRNGRADLPGPLSQLFLDRAGVYHVLAAGRCNHAGAGSWQGVTAGNTEMIGIEAQNAGDGIDPWPPAQMGSYVRGVAAILKHAGLDAVMVAGHKEFATPRGRKIDPTFDMFEFRAAVEKAMAGGTVSHVVARADPVRAMLRKGDRGESVKVLQRALGIHDDGDYGPATEKAVRAFQSSKGLVADGAVGPKTWGALL